MNLSFRLNRFFHRGEAIFVKISFRSCCIHFSVALKWDEDFIEAKERISRWLPLLLRAQSQNTNASNSLVWNLAWSLCIKCIKRICHHGRYTWCCISNFSKRAADSNQLPLLLSPFDQPMKFKPVNGLPSISKSFSKTRDHFIQKHSNFGLSPSYTFTSTHLKEATDQLCLLQSLWSRLHQQMLPKRIEIAPLSCLKKTCKQTFAIKTWLCRHSTPGRS